MFRSFSMAAVVCLCVGSLFAAEPLKFAEPLNISTEQGKILAAFFKLRSSDVPVEKAEAERDAALGQLANAAEAAKSEDHPALAQLYVLLKRPQDAAREARAALAANPKDFANVQPLVEALCQLKDGDNALAEFHKLAEQDVQTADVRPYLAVLPKVATTLATFYSDAKEFASAEQVLKDTQARLDKTRLQLGEKMSRDPFIRGSLAKAAAAVSTARQHLTKENDPKVASLPKNLPMPDTGNPLALPQKTATTRSPSTTSPTVPNTGNVPAENTANGKPIQKEINRIIASHTDALKRGEPQALVARNETLTQLAAKAEAAESPEYAALAVLYGMLGRHEDAVRAAQAARQADPSDLWAADHLIDSLCQLKRMDEAVAALHQLTVRDVPAADLSTYLTTVKHATRTVVDQLGDEGQFDTAEQVLEEAKTQFQKLKTHLPTGPKLDPKTELTISISIRLLDASAKSLNDKKPSSSVAKTGKPSSGTPTTSANRPPAKVTLAGETSDIVIAYNEALRKGTPEPDALAKRNASLAALAKKAEADQSTDHSALARLYLLLARYEEAAREATSALKANPNDLSSTETLIEAFCQLKRQEEAEKLFHELAIREVPIAEVSNHFSTMNHCLELLLALLADSDSNSAAEQVLNETQTQFEKLLTQVKANAKADRSSIVLITKINSTLALLGRKRDELKGNTPGRAPTVRKSD